MSFMCSAIPSNKESFQLFKVSIAIFLEGGKCYWCSDYHLVRVRDVYLLFSMHLDENLRLWGLGPVLALNREDL